MHICKQTLQCTLSDVKPKSFGGVCVCVCVCVNQYVHTHYEENFLTHDCLIYSNFNP